MQEQLVYLIGNAFRIYIYFKLLNTMFGTAKVKQIWIIIGFTFYFGSFANVGVVKSICKQVQTAAYQGSNHGISATGGFTSHGYSCRNRVSFVN